MNNHKQNKGYILTGVAVHCKINTSLSVNCQEVWNKNILQWITLCKMKHLTKRIWKLECRSWPVFVCQLEAVQQKLDSQETDIFFFDRLTGSWQSGTDHFTETEIQNTTKPPWLNGHPFLPLCPNLSYFLPFICLNSLFRSPWMAMREERRALAVYSEAQLSIHMEIPLYKWQLFLFLFFLLLLSLLL